MYEIIRAIGRHCKPEKTIVKYDGGHMSHLCCYCYLVLWMER